MVRMKIGLSNIYAFISLITLLYMRHYQTVLYYRNPSLISSRVYDIIYYMAGVAFFFFIAAFLADVVYGVFNFNITKIWRRVLTYILALALIIFIVLIAAGSIKMASIGSFSIYSVALAASGCLFALVMFKSKMERTIR